LTHRLLISNYENRCAFPFKTVFVLFDRLKHGSTGSY